MTINTIIIPGKKAALEAFTEAAEGGIVFLWTSPFRIARVELRKVPPPQVPALPQIPGTKPTEARAWETVITLEPAE